MISKPTTSESSTNREPTGLDQTHQKAQGLTELQVAEQSIQLLAIDQNHADFYLDILNTETDLGTPVPEVLAALTVEILADKDKVPPKPADTSPPTLPGIIFNSEHQYLRIENELFDFVTLYPFSKRKRKLFDVIYRQTIGYRKEQDDISSYQLSLLTGLSQSACLSTLKELATDGVIYLEQGRRGYLVKINRDFRVWASFAGIEAAWEKVQAFRAPKPTRAKVKTVDPFYQKPLSKMDNDYPKRSASINNSSINKKNNKPPTPSARLDGGTQVEGKGVVVSPAPLLEAKTKQIPTMVISNGNATVSITNGVSPLPSSITGRDQTVIHRLLAKLTPDQANEITEELTARLNGQGEPIRNPVGFVAALIRAVQNGSWSPSASRLVQEANEAKERAREQQQAEERARMDAERKQGDSEIALDEAIGAISAIDMERHHQTFIQNARNNGGLQFERMEKSGFRGPSYEIGFRFYLAQQLQVQDKTKGRTK